MKGKILLLWACLFSKPLLFAQMGYDLQVAVDTTKMRIGEQIEYILQVKADSTAHDIVYYNNYAITWIKYFFYQS